jgi:hypothetical protein
VTQPGRPREKGKTMKKKFCCGSMKYHFELKCAKHPDPWDIGCPDYKVVFMKKSRVYALPVRDGGSSFIIIKFCPWCGKRLPRSRMSGLGGKSKPKPALRRNKRTEEFIRNVIRPDLIRMGLIKKK